MVTVTSVPAPGVTLFERIQETVPPEPPDIDTLNATVPPAHKVVGVGLLYEVQEGEVATVVSAAASEVIVPQPLPLAPTIT